MKERTISSASAIAWGDPFAISAGDRTTKVGYGTGQHGWGSDFKNQNRYRKKSRRQKVKAARKANVRRQRGEGDVGFALFVLVIVLAIALFDGDPSIAESLRVMAAHAAGLKP